jgi:selenide,water dikinase
VRIGHDILLVGGGHTHVHVMTDFAARPEPGARLTLVADRLLMPYSGMLPGHVAGLYSSDDMHIDLARLARATGTRLIHAEAMGLDRTGRRLLLRDHPPLAYDTLSLNVGVTPDLSGIAGASTFGIAVKPIGGFLDQLDALLARAAQADGPRRIAIVGGGAAGVELAFALRTRLDAMAYMPGAPPSDYVVTLISSGPVLESLNAGARRRARARLGRRRIDVATDFAAVAIDAAALTAADGRILAVDAALFSTAARAPDWLAATGLPLAADGSVLTRRTLQAEDDDAVFAVGDCAVVSADARPKAGVFAVRQAPTLARNLRARLRGERLTEHRAQRRYLVLLSTGDGRAIAGWGRFFAAEGAWVWRWKDRIDRRFMARFSGFGAGKSPPAA